MDRKRKGIMTLNQFLVEQEGGGHYADFSEWQNFGRLLSIAQAKKIYVRVDTWRDFIEVKSRNFDESKKLCKHDVLKIPEITSKLIAKALGWEEKE